ncbi:aspartic peptidase domain-containing protein [Mycena epipterygia]|nr:aspartic peptidase domain-containing protein [Mycena epipterygia]
MAFNSRRSGDPAVEYLLLFDIGSSSSWLVDASCNSTSCPNKSRYMRTPYNAFASHTSNITVPASIMKYVGGSITGTAVPDVATLCHLRFVAGFLSATASSWSTTIADGFLGLAFGSAAEPNVPAFLNSMAQQHLLDHARFGIYAGNVTPAVEREVFSPINDGIWTIGGDRADEYAERGGGAIKFVNISKPYHVCASEIHAVSVQVNAIP